jgi:hypothetical protein
MTDVNALLLGSNGSPVLKFPQGSAPIAYKGTIVASQARQATDIKGTPKTFDSGDPMLEVVVTLNTDLRDNGPEDDGQRRLIAGFEMQKAIGQAMRDADVKELENGGLLAVEYYADQASDKPGYNPRKLYRAEYRPPTSTAGVNSLLGAAAEVPAQPAAQPASGLL